MRLGSLTPNSPKQNPLTGAIVSPAFVGDEAPGACAPSIEWLRGNEWRASRSDGSQQQSRDTG